MGLGVTALDVRMPLNGPRGPSDEHKLDLPTFGEAIRVIEPVELLASVSVLLPSLSCCGCRAFARLLSKAAATSAALLVPGVVIFIPCVELIVKDGFAFPPLEGKEQEALELSPKVPISARVGPTDIEVSDFCFAEKLVEMGWGMFEPAKARDTDGLPLDNAIPFAGAGVELLVC